MTNSTLSCILGIMEEKVRYRIKGKIYYKISEEQLKQDDYDLVDGIWHVKNAKGDEFRLLVGKGGRRYTMYTLDGKIQVLKTNSISKVTR